MEHAPSENNDQRPEALRQLGITLAGHLFDIGAVHINLDDPFRWSSGWWSPMYCDNRLTLSYPAIRAVVASGFQSLLASQNHVADAICGVATGGVPHGMLLADRLDLPFLYVRSAAKGHGLGNQLEGLVLPGKNVIVVEDLISTGSSSMQAVIALKEAGMVVQAVYAIFTYGFRQADRLFTANSLQVHALCTLQDILTVGKIRGLFDEIITTDLEDWREHPETWEAPISAEVRIHSQS